MILADSSNAISSRGNSKFLYNPNLLNQSKEESHISGEAPKMLEKQSSILDKYKMYVGNQSNGSIPSDGSLEHGSFSTSIANGSKFKDK